MKPRRPSWRRLAHEQHRDRQADYRRRAHANRSTGDIENEERRLNRQAAAHGKFIAERGPTIEWPITVTTGPLTDAGLIATTLYGRAHANAAGYPWVGCPTGGAKRQQPD